MPSWFATLAALLIPQLVTTGDGGAARLRPEVIHLWPNGAPGFEGRRNEPEQAKDWWVRNINNPSLTVFLPPNERATGAAVVIAPGGGFRELVFNAEGKQAAEFLNGIGVAAFVLKYRLPKEAGSPYTTAHVREDAYRAMRLVRSRARDWGVDPARVGILGFSAGGELASMIAYAPGDGDAKAADPIDRLNGKPSFQMLVYPGGPVPDAIPPTRRRRSCWWPSTTTMAAIERRWTSSPSCTRPRCASRPISWRKASTRSTWAIDRTWSRSRPGRSAWPTG
jgi:acetyl esterase/lipase